MADTKTGEPVSPGQLAWLAEQLPKWQTDGLVGDAESVAILARYRSVRRLSLGRLMLYLGASFVGIGVIWLVAANLDQFPPLGRFLGITALWLGITLAAELLASRPRHRPGTPVTGAARGLSALAFGAVIFQAGQSLQVPAYEPALIGWWGLGALLYAYAVRGVAPLVVGLVTALTWFVWQVAVGTGSSGLGVVLALLLAAVVAAAVTVLHDRRIPEFVSPWRHVGAALVLLGLFIAAVPEVDRDDFSTDLTTWLAVGLAALLAAIAALVSRGNLRYEPLAAAAVAVIGCGLVLWDPSTRVDEGLDFDDWAHAGLSVAVYVAVATWIAILGILRDSERLTWLALAALVIFTTFQSFAVFAQVIEGAWLFLVLGLIFLGSGYLFDRARRELSESLEGASA